MKKIYKKKDLTNKINIISFNIFVTSFFLLIGILLGSICSVNSIDFSIGEIIHFDNYSLGNVYFNLVKYLVIIFLSSFTVFGYILIPFCVMIKGFSVAFSITSIVQASGQNGIIWALSMFGLQTLVSIPCFLVVSASSIEISSYIATTVFKYPKRLTLNFPNYKRHFCSFLFCLFLLFAYALVDKNITPMVILYFTNNL